MLGIARCLVIIATISLTSAASRAAVLNVKTFGARGDGKTDDTKAIQAAIDAAPVNSINTIYFPRGTYQLRSYKLVRNYLENFFLEIHSNLIFRGETGATIRLADHLFDKTDSTANGHLFFGIEMTNVHFKNLLIDMNGANNLVPAGGTKNQSAIFIIRGKDVSIKNVSIKNNAGRNMIIIMGRGNNILVENSKFINGGHYVGSTVSNKHQIDFSFVYCEWDSARVLNNHIEQRDVDIALTSLSGGIELHGSNSRAAGNFIIGCNPGLYISSSFHLLENTVVEKNTFRQCIRGISFWVNYPMDRISIKDNDIELTHFRSWKSYTIHGIETPNGNTWTYDFAHANASTINNLLISGNTISGPTNLNNTDRSAGMVLHSVQNSTIRNNIIKGMNFGGIILQGSKWGSRNVEVSQNIFSDFKQNYDTVSPAAYVVVFDAYTPTDKVAPGLQNIHVSHNTFSRIEPAARPKNGSKRAGEFYGAFVALPAKMHEQVTFEKNVFSNKSERIVYLKTN